VAPRILIIEDNYTNMELMVYLLSAYGYELVTAVDGEEGLEKANDGKFDLIICDMEMPKLNGYQVAERLKGRLETRDVPLLAVTAYAMVGDRDKVLQAGFDGYFSKPIYPDGFVKQVESYLSPGRRLNSPPVLADRKELPVAAEQKTAKGRILVVDDSPINLSLIQSTLEPSGYELVLVETVEEGIEELRQQNVDVILSDLHMPAESGLEFLRRVKADRNLQSVPFILFTGSNTEEGDPTREHALRLGAEKYLTRPIEPRTLLAILDDLRFRRREGTHG
jgi:two-component system cell cycle response regulator